VLDLGAKAAGALGLSALFGVPAGAATRQRACVCVYLLGGNDSNNMIVPMDGSAYRAYAQGRGNLALSSASLLPVRAPATSASYGLHPALPGVQDLYNRGALSVVASVGRMDRPLAKGQFDAQQLPADLFLHSGASQIRYLSYGRLAIGWDPDSRSSDSATAPATNPGVSLRQRLLQLARQFGRNGAHGTYTAVLSGFDTHGDELNRQASLFAQLDEGLSSFYQNLESLGVADRVLVFTSTEFNRTLAPNGSGGSEHGWGGHYLVFGGSVHGGEVFGRFPSMELGGPDDLGASGVWIPSTSDEQFAATIARWYGITNLPAAFPNLDNFPQRELNFV